MIEVVKDSHNAKIYRHIENLNVLTERAIRQAYYKVGRLIQRESRQSIIQGPKTGRLYRIPGRKRKHRASAPGEPPANLFGNLQKSINFTVQGSKQLVIGAGDDTNVPYARILELGGKTKYATIQPRPYLIRAIDDKEKDTENIFNTEIKRTLNRL